uniref:Uncharacterized protein n=1 Tax=Anopheles maculatus TaxID=74869 RepID=A0A182T2H0_9DIPT
FGGTESKDGNIEQELPAEKRGKRPATGTSATDDSKHVSMESIYHPDLSVCSFAWSLDDSGHDNLEPVAGTSDHENKLKRYGVVLNASVNIDDDETKCHQQQQQQQASRNLQSNTSTPIRLGQSRSRSNILSSNLQPSSVSGVAIEPATSRSGVIYGVIKREQAVNHHPVLTAKDKSKTLPQNMSLASSLPAKSSFILYSTSRISANSSFDAKNCGSLVGLSTEPAAAAAGVPPAMTHMFSPKKSLSFIRRTHSTKLSRSNSLLKSLTSRCVDQSAANGSLIDVPVKELDTDRLCRILEQPATLDQKIRDIFILQKDEKEEENAVHSGKIEDSSWPEDCGKPISI